MYTYNDLWVNLCSLLFSCVPNKFDGISHQLCCIVLCTLQGGIYKCTHAHTNKQNIHTHARAHTHTHTHTHTRTHAHILTAMNSVKLICQYRLHRYRSSENSYCLRLSLNVGVILCVKVILHCRHHLINNHSAIIFIYEPNSSVAMWLDFL